MKKLFLPLAMLAMAALLGAAVVWDCVRLAADSRGRVEMADAEMQKHERRLVQLLIGSRQVSPAVRDAAEAHERAADLRERHAAYEQLVTSFRQTMSVEVDPTNPLDRKFMDDIAGAINRREIAQRPYDAEDAAYQKFLSSWRGSLARTFWPQARADWKQGH